MTQTLGDIRSGAVLLMALAVSGVAWWLVVVEPEVLPGFICGVAGYAVGGAWSAGLLAGRVAMWLPMMLAMALPVGVVIGLRAGRVPDGAFLMGYAGMAAGVALVAAVAEWALSSSGLVGNLDPRSGTLAGATFMALGLLNLAAVALRRSPSCMQDNGTWNAGGSAVSLFSPAGRSAERMRGDEGVAGGPEKTPSSDPSGHLLPDGEKRERTAASRSNRFLQGLHQGRLSLACSLTMVGLQLALGTMSLLLMIGMTLWMLAEALLPERRELPMALGAALVMAGLSVIAVTSVT